MASSSVPDSDSTCAALLDKISNVAVSNLTHEEAYHLKLHTEIHRLDHELLLVHQHKQHIPDAVASRLVY